MAGHRVLFARHFVDYCMLLSGTIASVLSTFNSCHANQYWYTIASLLFRQHKSNIPTALNILLHQLPIQERCMPLAHCDANASSISSSICIQGSGRQPAMHARCPLLGLMDATHIPHPASCNVLFLSCSPAAASAYVAAV
jgi:hypothetical protein